MIKKHPPELKRMMKTTEHNNDEIVSDYFEISWIGKTKTKHESILGNTESTENNEKRNRNMGKRENSQHEDMTFGI